MPTKREPPSSLSSKAVSTSPSGRPCASRASRPASSAGSTCRLMRAPYPPIAPVTPDTVARTMSPTGAEAVLHTRRAWEERDLDTVVGGMTPDVVHDLSHYEGFPGEPINTGVGPAL